MWLAVEVLSHLARLGRSRPSAVESNVALANWLAMTNRGLLSVFEAAYPWIAANRERKEVMEIPRPVRRELAAAAALLLLVGQDLSAPWCEDVLMVDASEWGGGICVTRADAQESSAEARWSPHGQWLTIGDESGLAEYWQASLPNAAAPCCAP